jgi:gas vesicle protein
MTGDLLAALLTLIHARDSMRGTLGLIDPVSGIELGVTGLLASVAALFVRSLLSSERERKNLSKERIDAFGEDAKQVRKDFDEYRKRCEQERDDLAAQHRQTTLDLWHQWNRERAFYRQRIEALEKRVYGEVTTAFPPSEPPDEIAGELTQGEQT